MTYLPIHLWCVHLNSYDIQPPTFAHRYDRSPFPSQIPFLLYHSQLLNAACQRISHTITKYVIFVCKENTMQTIESQTALLLGGLRDVLSLIKSLATPTTAGVTMRQQVIDAGRAFLSSLSALLEEVKSRICEKLTTQTINAALKQRQNMGSANMKASGAISTSTTSSNIVETKSGEGDQIQDEIELEEINSIKRLTARVWQACEGLGKVPLNNWTATSRKIAQIRPLLDDVVNELSSIEVNKDLEDRDDEPLTNKSARRAKAGDDQNNGDIDDEDLDEEEEDDLMDMDEEPLACTEYAWVPPAIGLVSLSSSVVGKVAEMICKLKPITPAISLALGLTPQDLTTSNEKEANGNNSNVTSTKGDNINSPSNGENATEVKTVNDGVALGMSKDVIDVSQHSLGKVNLNATARAYKLLRDLEMLADECDHIAQLSDTLCQSLYTPQALKRASFSATSITHKLAKLLAWLDEHHKEGWFNTAIAASNKKMAKKSKKSITKGEQGEISIANPMENDDGKPPEMLSAELTSNTEGNDEEVSVAKYRLIQVSKRKPSHPWDRDPIVLGTAEMTVSLQANSTVDLGSSSTSATPETVGGDIDNTLGERWLWLDDTRRQLQVAYSTAPSLVYLNQMLNEGIDLDVPSDDDEYADGDDDDDADDGDYDIYDDDDGEEDMDRRVGALD